MDNMRNNRFIWTENGEISTVDNIGSKLGPTHDLYTVRNRTPHCCSEEKAESVMYEVLMHSLHVWSGKGGKLCGLVQIPGWSHAWQALMLLCWACSLTHLFIQYAQGAVKEYQFVLLLKTEGKELFRMFRLPWNLSTPKPIAKQERSRAQVFPSWRWLRQQEAKAFNSVVQKTGGMALPTERETNRNQHLMVLYFFLSYSLVCCTVQ